MGRLKKKFRQPSMVNVFRKGPYLIKLGNYKAGSVCLQEACINNVVLRVELTTLHKHSSSPDKANSLLPNVDHIKVKRKRRQTKTKKLVNITPSPKLKSYVVHKKTPSSLKNGINKLKVDPHSARRQINQTAQGRRSMMKRYCLEFPCVPYVHSKMGIDLKQLSEMVCVMKLPSQLWKITVMLKGQTTAVFRFSKSSPSTSVTFYQVNPYYKILIDGVRVILLGCPKTVDTLRDIEILLDIVNRVNLRDCMVSKM